MILLDIIVGEFLPSMFGWAFLVFVLTTESFLLSKYLTKNWTDKTIFTSVIVSNLITTIIGYFLLGEESGVGGHLLNWIPVDHYHGDIRLDRPLFLFISTFIGSVIIETFSNWILLKRLFTFKQTLLGTLRINIFTYLTGGLTILLYNIYTL